MCICLNAMLQVCEGTDECDEGRFPAGELYSARENSDPGGTIGAESAASDAAAKRGEACPRPGPTVTGRRSQQQLHGFHPGATFLHQHNWFATRKRNDRLGFCCDDVFMKSCKFI